MGTVLNEGVQSAHAQIPFFLWSKGDDLQSHLQNAGHELLQRYTTNEFVVRMPTEYPGAARRIAKVVALVGDSKWIWSVFGVVQNWRRPVATGPFTCEQVIHICVHTHFTCVTTFIHIILVLNQVNQSGVHMPRLKPDTPFAVYVWPVLVLVVGLPQADLKDPEQSGHAAISAGRIALSKHQW